MVVISVILWPIGALIASLLIAKIYAQSRLAPTQTPPTPTASRSEDFEDWLILGVFLIGVGVYFWVKDYLPEPRGQSCLSLWERCW
jgi:uncharacterized paraquat-inducible protein A